MLVLLISIRIEESRVSAVIAGMTSPSRQSRDVCISLMMHHSHRGERQEMGTAVISGSAVGEGLAPPAIISECRNCEKVQIVGVKATHLRCYSPIHHYVVPLPLHGGGIKTSCRNCRRVWAALPQVRSNSE